jgi:branched-chain amino acid aminotransferase
MNTSKNIDWENLPFGYRKTDYNVRCYYRNGSWGELEITSEETINIHMAATALHYGQEAFEGLKAYRGKDGKVRLFRWEENAKRMVTSAKRLMMAPPPVDLFIDAVCMAIKLNMDWVPPYGTGASLYLRPLLIGTSPRVGVQACDEYDLYVLAMPVGPYYKNGFMPVKALLQNKYDRAAPLGTGSIKASGNYAAGMMGDYDGKAKGFPICLYADASEHKYIDEFGSSNFIAITADNKYVTPNSKSILSSITNNSLQVLAQDLGLTVEKRQISIDELDSFVEVGACGTAASITPVGSVTTDSKIYQFGSEDCAGEVLTKLYNQIQGIQYGEIEDRYNWNYEITGC